MCVYVCMCVRVWGRGREGMKKGVKDRGRGVPICVCKCVCV